MPSCNFPSDKTMYRSTQVLTDVARCCVAIHTADALIFPDDVGTALVSLVAVRKLAHRLAAVDAASRAAGVAVVVFI